MDFKVDLQTEQGQWLHLHTVRDPVGAAFITALLYPAAGKRTKVSFEQVRTTLRQAFSTFGLPEEVQTDGEPVLNPQAGDTFPSLFTLWLAGLGIRHLRGRPGVPTDDAEVERAHRTLYDYVLIDHLDALVDPLQEHLHHACLELNHEYPSRAHGCYGRPPMQAHPELLHPPRPFDPHYELARFDLSKVDAYLSSLSFERKVGKTGQISLGKRLGTYSVGRSYARQKVIVRFDPSDRCFVAFHQDREIRRWKAKQLEVEHILGFALLSPGLCPQQLALPFPASPAICS